MRLSPEVLQLIQSKPDHAEAMALYLDLCRKFVLSVQGSARPSKTSSVVIQATLVWQVKILQAKHGAFIKHIQMEDNHHLLKASIEAHNAAIDEDDRLNLLLDKLIAELSPQHPGFDRMTGFLEFVDMVEGRTPITRTIDNNFYIENPDKDKWM